MKFNLQLKVMSVSFDIPEYTADITALGAENFEAIKF